MGFLVCMHCALVAVCTEVTHCTRSSNLLLQSPRNAVLVGGSSLEGSAVAFLLLADPEDNRRRNRIRHQIRMDLTWCPQTGTQHR